MKALVHFEVPHLALWKSAVSKVLAGDSKAPLEGGAGVDMDHPIMQATDRYCQAIETNTPIPKPPVDSNNEGEVLTYLSFLHHKRVHAHIAGNAQIEADLKKQTQEYKYGNPLWQLMFQEYFKYYWQYPYHKGGAPKYRSWQDAGKGDLQYGVVEWKLPAKCRVVIVGDIGTGTDVAAAVLVAALKFKPDAILHLGDVYYSGTEFEMKHRLAYLLRDVMKIEKVRVPFFTVPGNHEYFTGAGAYLKTLDSGVLTFQNPSQKQAASYFSLRTADDGWQFLGLDTGYNGHYMNVPEAAQHAVLEQLHFGNVESPGPGADAHWPSEHNPFFRKASGGNLPVHDLTSNVDQIKVRPDELAWHMDKLTKFPGASVLLSHHQLYSALNVCGIAQKQIAGPGGAIPDPTDFNRAWVNTGLWRQFGPMFGVKVAAWIWGHEHNLGIFEDAYRPADWPTNTPEATEVFRTLPLGRCAGHSAIPVAQTEGPYVHKYPLNLKRSDLALGITDGWYNHGFELMEINGAGQAARLSYFQVAGADPTPLPIFVEQVPSPVLAKSA